jgi:DNA-binding IclR family transcriptional regulator
MLGTMSELKTPENPSTKVPAVTRAVAILRKLGASSEPLGVNSLARDLDLVPSTCLHILRALVAEGLVDFDVTSKRYAIGLGILPIAHSAIQRSDFATLAQPMLVALSERFAVTTMATQLFESQEMVVVALSHAQLPFRLSTDLGSRFPAMTSATGRCVAAYGDFDAAALRARFDRAPWDNPPRYKSWKAQVEVSRRDGYGVDVSEFISGVTIVAAPFFSPGGEVVRSLVALGTSEKMESAGVPRVAHEMLRMRDELTDCLIRG